MKIKNVRIKNYKSIIDSEILNIEGGVTIFAGKNESGKTSILEALEDFNIDKEIRKEARSLKNQEISPEIIVTFTLTKEEVNQYFQKFGMSSKNEEDQNITIIKKLEDLSYYTINEVKFFGLNSKYNKKYMKGLQDEIIETHSTLKKKYDKLFRGAAITFIEHSFSTITNKSLTLVEEHYNAVRQYDKYENNEIQNLYTEYIYLLSGMKKDIVHYIDFETNQKQRFDYILDLIPNFILVNDLSYVISNIFDSDKVSTVTYQEILEVFDVDREKFNKLDSQQKKTFLLKKNQEINNKYSIFWHQDDVKLELGFTSKFEFWIQENDTVYKPEQRSKGKQWHLAFFFKIYSKLTEKKNNIIMIDEPGSYLHPSAQKNIYDLITHVSEKHPVIFTTHSPFLIKQDELEKIRLVEKKENQGTKILNRIKANSSEATLAPILAAIGMSLNDGIQHTNLVKNVIVEGFSDVYYLRAIAKLNNITDIQFVSGGGAGNLGNIGAILAAWGCKVIYLLDHDHEYSKAKKNLTHKWKIEEQYILTVSDKINHSIEDLFETIDFKQFLSNNNIDVDEKNNTVLLNKLGENKVLVARKFFKEVSINPNFQLNDHTINNFNKLFDKLKKAFDLMDIE